MKAQSSYTFIFQKQSLSQHLDLHFLYTLSKKHCVDLMSQKGGKGVFLMHVYVLTYKVWGKQ